jgi:hypothetical protein
MMPAATPNTPTTSRPDIVRLGEAVMKRLQNPLLKNICGFAAAWWNDADGLVPALSKAPPQPSLGVLQARRSKKGARQRQANLQKIVYWLG